MVRLVSKYIISLCQLSCSVYWHALKLNFIPLSIKNKNKKRTQEANNNTLLRQLITFQTEQENYSLEQ